MCVVQGTTSIMFRVLNSNSTSSFNSIDKHKFIYFSTSSNINNINNLNDYPLNLLFDKNLLLYGALIFLYIILNIYISKYILNLNYNKFIPNNKIGKIIKFFNRSLFKNMK